MIRIYWAQRVTPVAPYPTLFSGKAQNQLGNEEIIRFEGRAWHEIEEIDFFESPSCFNFFSDEAFVYYFRSLIELDPINSQKLHPCFFGAIQEIGQARVGLEGEFAYQRKLEFHALELSGLKSYFSELQKNGPVEWIGTDELSKALTVLELLELNAKLE